MTKADAGARDTHNEESRQKSQITSQPLILTLDLFEAHKRPPHTISRNLFCPTIANLFPPSLHHLSLPTS